MRSITAIAACTLLGVSAQAGATLLFAENFDSITANTLQITTTAGSMVVTGAVDAVVPANPFGISGLTSTVIDLDGSPGPGGVASPGSFTVARGFVYTLSFVFGGAQRGSAADNVTTRVDFGTPFTGSFSEFGRIGGGRTMPVSNILAITSIINLAGDAPFLASGFVLTPTVASSVAFSIRTTSADAVGPLLDSVSLTRNAIPEPASWAMLIAGFGLVGAALRRRAAAVAA